MTPWLVHELRNLGLEFLDARHARAALKVQIKKTDQCEREVTGERIRDKVAASKKKGMWMGGMPPLGYDVKNRKLVVNMTRLASTPKWRRRDFHNGRGRDHA
jgi:hypothetical protein